MVRPDTVPLDLQVLFRGYRMNVGDLVRDIRCGTLCVVKRIGPSYMVVWSFSGNEEVAISIDNLEWV